MLLRSSKMARFVNEKIPGVAVPPAIIEEMDKASDPVRQGVEIAARLVKEIRGIAHGVHIMTMEREELLPDILSKSGI
jgi:methylenetetrahydrofolate reductase (NADPH)